jgi:uncharacterized protein (TIGR02145 family)
MAWKDIFTSAQRLLYTSIVGVAGIVLLIAGISCNSDNPVNNNNIGTITDADGNVYQTVRIGNQVWMAENLRATKYNDGSVISSDASWNNAALPNYCFYQNTTNSDSIEKYGALYNWHVVNNANPKKIAPTGWHVPSDAEWDTLQNYLIAKGCNWDGTMTGNKIAKSLAAKTDWETDTTAGTIGCDATKNNSSGFSALPGGHRSGSGIFYARDATWWSATQADTSSVYYRYLGTGLTYLLRGSSNYSCGFAIRLVRD